ncbi:hypothetical protein [Gemmata obscuriglobus]|uniref:hypothetical protein n=1 Tax=Gemmata obscuriglobus TaxID=114 RepID=UPI0002E925E2|nr:hypothetical protein [Gemmata obscuriglobus]
MGTWFSPLHVGIGSGVSQGLLVGLVVGAVAAVAVAWRREQIPAPTAHQKHAEPGAAPDTAI